MSAIAAGDQAGADDGVRPDRPAWLAFAAATLSFTSIFTASGAPIPLYELYRRTEGLTKADLSFTAVSYFLAAMVALLMFGRVSNVVGRRPVALAALALAAAGTLVLLHVTSASPLIVGRTLQGLGCGLASSAIAAYIVDSAPRRPAWLGAAVSAGGPMVGITLGAVSSGALAEYGPHPRTLVFWIVLGLLAISAAMVVAGPETAVRTAGPGASLRPDVRVPPAVRRLLPAAACVFVATWALGGFYQAFGPTITSDQLDTHNTLVLGALFAAFIAPSAAGALVSGRLAPAPTQRLGMGVFMAGVVLMLISLHLGRIAPFLVATMILGAMQGVTFSASTRSLLTHTAPADRAGVMSTIYIIAYTGTAVPALVAGQLTRAFSLFTILLGYGALTALALVVTLVTARDPQ
ncbi:MFS transporter [Baekduia soli]|uniref:MFS transporter n=1 Tax=Baekduia soli TaxID=496014 RepID=A0A5B8U0C9_9ACTN|nr:MFS transporter [Baekduia soli]QEC46421.1 MFS transporter [Baekduia soli]